MQSLSTLIRISGPIPEVKKTIALINDWEDIATYWQGIVEEVWFDPIAIRDSGGGTFSLKFCNFYPH